MSGTVCVRGASRTNQLSVLCLHLDRDREFSHLRGLSVGEPDGAFYRAARLQAESNRFHGAGRHVHLLHESGRRASVLLRRQSSRKDVVFLREIPRRIRHDKVVPRLYISDLECTARTDFRV